MAAVKCFYGENVCYVIGVAVVMGPDPVEYKFSFDSVLIRNGFGFDSEPRA